MSTQNDLEMVENETITDILNIKEENSELTIDIKPESEYNDQSNIKIEDENPFQNVQLEIKQDPYSHDSVGDDDENIKTQMTLHNDMEEMYHISDSKVNELHIKIESECNEMIISNDYPPLDDRSMDSNEAIALHNVEACLQDEVDTKLEGLQVMHKETKVKDELDVRVTETHLISNKVINTTSTVTMPCEGLIESQTTKTLIMEIHPVLHTESGIQKLGIPEVILPTPYNEGFEDIQLNSITSNILPLEQEAYGLLKAKKKKYISRQYQYACPKCPKIYKAAYDLKRHMAVHDTIERRAIGVMKGRQTRIENKNKNTYDTIKKVKKRKDMKNKDQQGARKVRLEKRLQRIKDSQLGSSNDVAVTRLKQEIKVKEVKVENVKKEGYECSCGKVFRRKSRMETCLRSHEIYSDSTNYTCVSCGKQFNDKTELGLHRKRLHRKRFPCKFCPTDYKSKKELFKHLQIHQKVQLMEYKVITQVVKGKQKLKCFMCSKAYSEISELKYHVMDDHKEPYVCRRCNDTFSKIIDFCNHTKTQHPEVEGQPVLDVLEAFSKLVKAWKCGECELQFHEADKLAKHKVEKHSLELKVDAQYQCPDCHRVFITQKGLTSHRRIHDKPPVNAESFEESESTEQGVMCIECRKICKDMDTLTSHMRLHSPERKYPCKFCDFRFTTPEKRKAHTEIHTGDMKYVCFICEYQCSSENRLHRHKMSLKHANMKEFLATGKPLVEEEPSTSTKSASSSKESGIKRRKKDKETEDETELVCDVCGDRFTNRKKMLKHKNEHPFIEFPNEDTPTRIFFK